MITITGDQQMFDGFRALSARVGNMQSVFESIGARLVSAIDQSFQTAVSPDGSIWDSLAPATIAARGGSSDPLVDSGQLRSSVVMTADSGGIDIQIGTADRPASPHFLGGRLPQRSPLPNSGGKTEINIDGSIWETIFDQEIKLALEAAA